MGVVPEDGISHVVVMGCLYAIEKDAVLEFAGISENTPTPGNHVSANEDARSQLAVFPDPSGPGDGAEWRKLDRPFKEDRALYVETGWNVHGQLLGQVGQDVLDPGKPLPGGLIHGEKVSDGVVCRQSKEIGCLHAEHRLPAGRWVNVEKAGAYKAGESRLTFMEEMARNGI